MNTLHDYGAVAAANVLAGNLEPCRQAEGWLLVIGTGTPSAVRSRDESRTQILSATIISSAKSWQLPRLDFNVSTGLCVPGSLRHT
jgi:hypothetical protein